MSKHTPGPWIADSVNTQDDSVTAVWQFDGSNDYYHRMPQICECFWDPSGSETFDARPLTLAEAEANALLIAAAPELLDALRILAGVAAVTPGMHGLALDNARAAISKATGENP